MSHPKASVFINYNWGDKPLARALAGGLEGRGYWVWIDEGELRAGDSIVQRVSEAIAQVDFLVALVSPASIGSQWCRKEISLAMTGEIARQGITVIPLKVGNVEMPATLVDKLYLSVDPEDTEAAVVTLVSHIERHLSSPTPLPPRRRMTPPHPSYLSRSKKVTRQTLIGEAGIALIHGRVTEMGFLFHPRRVDHGIDGHIDLVNPGTGEVLNLVVQVQSKASTLPFPYEDANGFQYTCNEIDLNYWLSGNTPVILVLSHPDENEAWWVDIKTEFSDLKRRASRTVVVDKNTQAFDASAAAALLSRAAPKGSGLFLSPPPKLETLTSNLLRVDRMPEVIYIAPSAASTYSAAGELLASQPKRGRGDWILRDGLVISFSDLTQSPLNVLCSGDVERHDTGEWSESDDQDVQHRLMDLLARTVGADHYADLRWHRERRHLHFRPTPDLAPRREGRGPGRPGRTVFSAYHSKRDPDKISFYRHAAVTTRFRRLGGSWYCQLGVDYCFSRDGHNESAFADALLTGIKRFDRHAAVAGWTKTWATYFGKPPNLFEDDKVVIFGKLATLEVDRGIEDRLWSLAPLQVSEEDSENRADQAANEAELAVAGIEQEDLFALLAEDHADQDELAAPPRTQSRRRRRDPDKTDRSKRRRGGVQ